MIIKKKKEVINDSTLNEKKLTKNVVEEKIDLFDLDNIEFSQRQERRRGDRRRGYRRIDDRNLISRAQEEAGSIKDNAATEGYKAGLEESKKDIDELRSVLQNFVNTQKEVFEYIAPDILEISIDIASRIIKKEISQDPQLILDTILDVLKTIPKDEPKIVIKVNPSQLAITKENIPEVISSIGLESRTSIISDDSIEIGGCIIETSNGIVDATLNTRLDIIKEAFKGM